MSSSRKFRFVSPGVFLKEIDNSQLPSVREALGPVIIGKTTKGPALKPTKVRSLEELEIIFGKSPAGGSVDPWREGSSILSDSHAMHAARAYLTAGDGTDSPVTIVRLLGIPGDDAAPDTAGEPGWETKNAYGLFLIDDPSTSISNTGSTDAELAAIFYGIEDDFGVKLSGTEVSGSQETATGGVIGSVVNFASNDQLEINLSASTGTTSKKTLFANIRKDLNTNPVATNMRISNVITGTLADKYWLGETFEQTFSKFDKTLTSDGKKSAFIVKLASGPAGMSDFRSSKHGATAARTGWIFGQDTTNNNTTFSVDNQQKLFRVIALHEGQQSSKELIIGIEDIQVPREGSAEEYGSFALVVRQIGRRDIVDLERFSNLNFDPSSENFIARRIGDQITEWNSREKRNKTYGEFPNKSQYIRVEMNSDIINGAMVSKEQVPFGFFGPVRPATIGLQTELQGAVTAQGTLTVKVDGPAGAAVHANTITIKDTDGTAIQYTFDNGLATGSVGSNAGAPKIGIAGVTGSLALATAIRDALLVTTPTNRADLKLSIGDPVDDGSDHKITITQTYKGPIADSVATSADASNIVANAAARTGNLGHTGTEFITASASDWAHGSVKVNGIALTGATVNLKWPSMPLINTSSAGNNYFMGVSPYTLSYGSEGESTDGSTVYPGYVDFLRRMSAQATSAFVGDQDSGFITAGKTEYSFKFTLDDVILAPRPGLASTGSIAGTGDVSKVVYKSGSKNALSSSLDRSYSAHVSTGSAGTSLRTLLDIVGGFHMPLDGGHDGLDITESDPFNESVLSANSTALSYAFASIDRAIELIKDPEATEHNLAVMPGISNTVLTTKLVDTCEARADSLAIIDLPGVYVPPSQKKYDTFQERLTVTPEQASQALVERQLNSSYGAAYYPWVKIKDTSRGRDLWAPPSVVALGVMANTERNSEVWFAPAGFNRGGLNQGNAGVPVLSVTEQLLSKDRDTLYQANINPIASFVSEGIVVFGQKTLQSTQSALDRINVRRLLIFVKKEVSRISRNLLFEQNIQATWTRFHGQVRPFLESVKVRFGLTDFKVVLDSTTTTPDLVDRNIMYAKIFLKPARSIEFIAVDFVITRSGASFADPLE